jgi:hypothetical protein
VEIDATVQYNDLGIPVICQDFFDRYVERTGQAPGRNYMMRHAALAEIGEHQVKVAWEVLVGKRRAAPRRHKPNRKKGDGMTPEQGQQDLITSDSEATEDDQVTSLGVAVVKHQARMAALEQQVADLRELIMQVPTKTLPLPAELAVAVGRLQADGARTATNVQRLYDRQDASDRRMDALETATRPWQEFWRRLCESEDCWESWLSMLRSCSHHTKKMLLAFFADSTGHALSHNDKVPQ